VNLIAKKLEASPTLARVVPFAIFVAFTFCQGKFGASSAYWFYLGKTVVGAWLIWTVRPFVAEMRWNFSWEAVLVGIAIFAAWVGLDGVYPKPGKGAAEWNPHATFGLNAPLAWTFIVVRVLGSSIVVPPLEEVFYRSFLYRYVAKPDFQSFPLGQFGWTPFLATAAIFGFAHHEWLAGILCGFAYQGLVCWKKRLGDAMTAHAITNFLLGVWVVWRGAWHFW
jgi:CAAX prenyl protease-like protein